MTRIFIFLLTFCCAIAIGQDSYHSELLNQLENEYGLTGGQFVLNNTEQQNTNDITIYGNVGQESYTTTSANYSIIQKLTVNAAGNNQWDAGYRIDNKATVSQDDIILITFVAKRLSSQTELFLFAENNTTYDKETYLTVNLEPDWNTYYHPIKLSATFNTNRLGIGFHLASMAQEFEIAGFTILNYGDQYDIEDFPSSFGLGAYEGSEEDAEWRVRAADRIESHRKSDLHVNVKDLNGNVIENASVSIAMKEHEFGFGSAFVTCRFPGNGCFNNIYVNKIFDLDGEGHGFNVGVTENALKWDGWEENWIGTPEEAVDAIEYLHSQGVDMRGHTLIWPGFNNMPDDINSNRTNLNYVRNRVEDRIEEMILHPELKDIITEWDVLNEITQNRDLEGIFINDANFTTGREIYPEIFEKVKTEQPDFKIYVNDYVVLSGGGASLSVVNRYKTYLDELMNANVEWEGIGFQCHIGAQPTSILKIENTLNEFTDRYGKRIKITEYDISPTVDEDVQADYMSDFLTMIFSHSSVDAFIMWGFWDGNHWKGNAPMFDINWNLKPSGQAFNDKVFNEWWTEETQATDSQGVASFRGFKGTYELSIALPNGEVIDTVMTLSDDTDLSIQTSYVSTSEVFDQIFQIGPNPVIDNLIIRKNDEKPCVITITTEDGKQIYQQEHRNSTIEIPLHLIDSSLLHLTIHHGEEVYKKKIAVINN